jgi:hypothetical protein
MLAHLAGDMSRDNVAVFKLDAEHGIGQRLNDGAIHFKRVFFRHAAGFLTRGWLKKGLTTKPAAFCLNSAIQAKAQMLIGRKSSANSGRLCADSVGKIVWALY